MANVPSSFPLGIWLTIFINIISILASLPPNRAEHALQPRATFVGGFALSDQQCPSGAISCGTHSCCPANTACRSYALNWFCCPSEIDCTPTVKSFPVCADPSWVLYDGKSKGERFCCQAGEQGVYPGPGVGGAGLCVASDMSVAVTQTAFKYTIASGSSLSMSGSVSTSVSSAPASNSATASTAQTSATQSTSAQSSVIQTTSVQNPTGSTSSSASASTSSKSSSAAGSTSLLTEIAIVKAIAAIGFWLMVCL